MEKCVLSDLSIWLVCCLVLCFGGSAESSGEIAREFELTSPTSHYTIVTTKLSWNDAQGACARTSSHLVYVNSTEESEYLKQAVSRYELPLKDYWIGLVRDDVNWTWQDGTGLGYTNWREVGTSSGGDESDEDRECVTINMSTQQWKTKECHKKNYYICEREIVEGNQTVLTPTPAVTEPAPSLETKEAVYKASPSDMAAPMDRHHVQSMSALSLFRCATYCLRHNNCASFNYKSAEGKAKLDSFCELYSMQFSDEELTEKRGYRHYRV